MRILHLLFALVLLPFLAKAQLKTAQANWQQHVDYYLNVRLNDVDHTLTGNARFVYTNNSPNALTEMHFHLWPNGYKNDSTDFAKQQLLNGKTDFHFADDKDRGYIDQLDFKINGQKVDWKYKGNQIDICILTLNKPIQSGETVEIETPFFVKIPGSFSRFGHENNEYQITQWYPKPAVYDVNGWNSFSYLDQGEFYSEFGKFEVKITLPQNYVVAATGQLQEKSEKDFLENRIDYPKMYDSTPASTNSTKTITFIQDSIHDFAWFASKKYNVAKSEVILKNERLVETYVYGYQPIQRLKSLTKDIATALQYYSNHCGFYPYSHCSVVEGKLEAGGGMEYPMITVLSIMMPEVVVHEVGHNWFYGILANNERQYPWMDESINSYFEGKAMNRYVPKAYLESHYSLSDLQNNLLDIFSYTIEQIEDHQAIGIPAIDYAGYNYGYAVYAKGAQVFRYLNQYLGQETTDLCFKTYFERWAYKHPLPSDFRAVFEEKSGKNLSWFFDDLLISEEHLDYKILTSKDTIFVQNLGQIACPYMLGFYREGKLINEMWVEGHNGIKGVAAPNMDYDLVKIDPYGVMPEINQQNNSMRKSGMFKKIEPLQIGFMSLMSNPNVTKFSFAPALAWNGHNRGMQGLILSNSTIPQQKNNFTTVLLYSRTTKTLNGYFDLSFANYKNEVHNKTVLGVKAASFSHLPNYLIKTEGVDELYQYTRISPFLTFGFRNHDKRLPISSSLTLRTHLIREKPLFDIEQRKTALSLDTGFALGRRSVTQLGNSQFIELIFNRKNGKALNPNSFEISLQTGLPKLLTYRYDTTLKSIATNTKNDMFVKLNAEFNKHITYKIKKKGLDIRLFGGIFLDPSDDATYHYRLESAAGKWDYTYMSPMLYRGVDNSSVFHRQVLPTQTYFKNRGNYGNISQWVMAANLKSDLPFRLPLGVYLDFFTFNDIKSQLSNSKQESFLYSGGLIINLIPDLFEIYMPFFSSTLINDIQNLQGYKNFGQKITFCLNLDINNKQRFSDIIKKS
ncbi:MAG: M1 family metallopeptidase [Flavobacteriales bacterium]|nr:M1 family metallopeptidase [Flavobacteriales bacterium]